MNATTGSRATAVRAIHAYARARAAIDFKLFDLPLDEAKRRAEQTRIAHERIDQAVVEALPATVATAAIVPLLRDFEAQLENYVTNRRDNGSGADAAADVLDALDALIRGCAQP